MKYFTCIFICFLSVISIAQSELTGAAVDIVINDTRVEVQQQLTLNVPDSIQKIALRALEFAGTNLTLEEISSAGKSLNFEQTEAEGLNVVTVTSNQQAFKTLDIRYTIIAEKAHFYLPLSLIHI